MVWNEPGGNGSKDPWGDRSGRQGPPDLDEVLKKLKTGIGGLFGRGGGGGGSGVPSDFRVGGAGLTVILLVAVVAWGIWGFFIIEPPEQGVVLRFGKFVDIANPGPNWIARPFSSVEKVDVEQIHVAEIGFRSSGTTTTSVEHESLMLTEDENIIDIKFAVLYRINEPDRFKFNLVDPENTLRQATEAAVREIVGRSTLDVITEGRGEVSAEAETLIQEILDRYGEGGAGILVTSVNMQEAQPPRQVQAAFEDAVKAREDEERYKNEARAYAADILPKARGDANAILEMARAYKEQVVAAADGETSRFLNILAQYQLAPKVTRLRLYLESVESVIANSSKVLMDVEGGNNLMYLPIDKLIDPARSGSQRRIAADELRDSGATFGDEVLGNSNRARSRE